MADPEHLDILKQGVEVWNKWRSENPTVRPDLIGAELHEKVFSGANFSNTLLRDTTFNRGNLQGADLNRAFLPFASFVNVNLKGADLSNVLAAGTYFSDSSLTDVRFDGADIQHADFGNADLSGAKFNRAQIINTNFFGTILKDADFAEATIAYVSFNNTDLGVAQNLDSVQHVGPSSIGIDTIYKSHGKISEKFLRACGVLEDFITHMPTLVAAIEPIQFYSCFISYSHKDEEFARRLYSRMRDEGLRVWYAPEEMKGGRKLHEQIFSAIQLHDKLLLVLSKNSLQSDWVMTEIRRARKAEREENRRKLFPIRLVDFEAIQQWECFDADSGKDLTVELREYFIPDFSNWKDHDAFENAFDRLLRDLKAEEDNGLNLETTSNSLYQRAVLSPRNTFREEWDKVESSIIRVAKRYGWVNEGEMVDCGQLINKLFEAEKIDKDTKEEFFSLSKWHNNVVLFNSSPVEPGMAIHFADRAKELQKAFDRLLRDLRTSM
jgi:hypothetical protein